MMLPAHFNKVDGNLTTEILRFYKESSGSVENNHVKSYDHLHNLSKVYNRSFYLSLNSSKLD